MGKSSTIWLCHRTWLYEKIERVSKRLDHPYRQTRFYTPAPITGACVIQILFCPILQINCYFLNLVFTADAMSLCFTVLHAVPTNPSRGVFKSEKNSAHNFHLCRIQFITSTTCCIQINVRNELIIKSFGLRECVTTSLQ